MDARFARRAHGIAFVLLLILVTELTLSVRRQSLSWDEGDHIYAGYQSWKAADFGINPEHPPLAKEMATLPLLGMRLQTPVTTGRVFDKTDAYIAGREMIYRNGGLDVANRVIFRARMFAAVFSVLMATVVYLTGLEMFGAGAALFALALIVFEPNLLAHGAYVTTDMAVTCFLFAAVFALYRFRERPSWQRLVVLGAAVGLGLAAKHSAVLLLPIALSLAVFELIWPAVGEKRAAIVRQYSMAVAGATAIGVAILWATYGFRYSSHPNGRLMTPTLAEYVRPLHSIEPRLYLLLARFHVLPESYLFGLADIRRLSTAGRSFPTYIFGQVHAHGVWYYFPAAFVIKSTLGFMLLLGVSVYAVASRKLEGRRRLAFLVIPPAMYLTIAMCTGLNIGARHILPLYPFLAVLIGRAAAARTRRTGLYAVMALLTWHVASSMRSYPVYMAHSNELFGGPSGTYRYLTDSNVDWGQQLLSVKAYLDKNGIKECWFGYFVQPLVDYHDYGIPCRELPTMDGIWADQQVDTPPSITGTVLVSAGVLSGYEFGSALLSPYQPFVRSRPVAVIDQGVFVFQGTFDTRFASALGNATRASTLLRKKDAAGALAAAQRAVATDPNIFQGRLILGDTLAALKRDRESAAVYEEAARIAERMEPEAKAKADKLKLLESKKRDLHP